MGGIGKTAEKIGREVANAISRNLSLSPQTHRSRDGKPFPQRRVHRCADLLTRHAENIKVEAESYCKREVRAGTEAEAGSRVEAMSGNHSEHWHFIGPDLLGSA